MLSPFLQILVVLGQRHLSLPLMTMALLTYVTTNRLFRKHHDTKSEDDQPLFCTKVFMFTPNKPDLILHAGTSSKAPIVATSKILKSCRDLNSNWEPRRCEMRPVEGHDQESPPQPRIPPRNDVSMRI